jgi:hypothetical protein
MAVRVLEICGRSGHNEERTPESYRVMGVRSSWIEKLCGACGSGLRAGSLLRQEPVPTAVGAGLPRANAVALRVTRLFKFVLVVALLDALSDHVAAGNLAVLIAVQLDVHEDELLCASQLFG